MPDKPSETKSFAQFLGEQPAPAETVTLTGSVARSPRQGAFVLDAGGQTLELPVDAVQSYKVVSEEPKILELQVTASKIDSSRITKSPAADAGIQKNPIVDQYHTRKEIITDPLVDKHPHKDPILDPITLPETVIPDPTNTIAEGVGGFNPGGQVVNPAAGAQPFVLATPHHAPASTIAAQLGGAAGAQLATTPLTDRITILWFDHPYTLKELIKDPITDPITLPETVIPDPTNTIAEGIGGFNPGGQVVNPAAGAQFALSAQMSPQTMAAQQLITNPVFDRPITLAWLDHPHTVPAIDVPNTLKELIKDPIQDPITWVEQLPGGGGGGTLQEGVGGGLQTNPVWNLPGMMF